MLRLRAFDFRWHHRVGWKYRLATFHEVLRHQGRGTRLYSALGLTAIRRFYQFDTTVLPQELDRSSALVTSGILKISRNPMYLGMAAVIAGVGIGIGTWIMLPILGLFVFWITEYQIKPEERSLVKIFGSEFEDYKSKVRRWI